MPMIRHYEVRIIEVIRVSGTAETDDLHDSLTGELTPDLALARALVAHRNDQSGRFIMETTVTETTMGGGSKRISSGGTR